MKERDARLNPLQYMVAANPHSVMKRNNRGSTPLHLACQVGQLDVVKYLIKTYEDGLQICNSGGEFPLQVSCNHGRCNVINYILEKSDH